MVLASFKQKPNLFAILIVATMLIVSGCDSDLTRYADRAECLGYFDRGVAGFHHVPTYEFVTHWSQESELFLVAGKDLGVISIDLIQGTSALLLAPPTLPWATVTDLTDSSAVFVFGTGEDASTAVYSLESGFDQATPHIVLGTLNSKLNVDSSLLASVWTNGFEHGISNRLVTFDLVNDPRKDEMFEFNTAIADVLECSNSGSYIAVSEYSPQGEVLRFVDLVDDSISRSGFNAANSCVRDVTWLYDDSEVIYSGENAETQGWDLVRESILSGDIGFITQSQEEDELQPAVSPAQGQLAYVKRFRNEQGEPVQELFLIDMRSEPWESRPITSSIHEYEFAPTWISERQLVYLVWTNERQEWEVRMVSTDTLEIEAIIGIEPSP